jgi:hypothetical protein
MARNERNIPSMMMGAWFSLTGATLKSTRAG